MKSGFVFLLYLACALAQPGGHHDYSPCVDGSRPTCDDGSEPRLPPQQDEFENNDDDSFNPEFQGGDGPADGEHHSPCDDGSRPTCDDGSEPERPPMHGEYLNSENFDHFDEDYDNENYTEYENGEGADYFDEDENGEEDYDPENADMDYTFDEDEGYDSDEGEDENDDDENFEEVEEEERPPNHGDHPSPCDDGSRPTCADGTEPARPPPHGEEEPGHSDAHYSPCDDGSQPTCEDGSEPRHRHGHRDRDSDDHGMDKTDFLKMDNMDDDTSHFRGGKKNKKDGHIFGIIFLIGLGMGMITSQIFACMRRVCCRKKEEAPAAGQRHRDHSAVGHGSYTAPLCGGCWDEKPKPDLATVAPRENPICITGQPVALAGKVLA